MGRRRSYLDKTDRETLEYAAELVMTYALDPLQAVDEALQAENSWELARFNLACREVFEFSIRWPTDERPGLTREQAYELLLALSVMA